MTPPHTHTHLKATDSVLASGQRQGGRGSTTAPRSVQLRAGLSGARQRPNLSPSIPSGFGWGLQRSTAILTLSVARQQPRGPALPGRLPHSGHLLTTCLFSGFSSEKRHLQVNVTNPVQCSLHGKKCTVSVETRLNQPQPDFTKNRSGFILSVPGN